jgi:hypothetical protein
MTKHRIYSVSVASVSPLCRQSGEKGAHISGFSLRRWAVFVQPLLGCVG